MKYLGWLFLFLFGISQVVLAEDDEDDLKRFSVFGGYSRIYSDFANTGDVDTLNGFNVSITGYLNDYLGLTADFSSSSGQYGSKYKHFLFGPEIRFRMGKRIEPYLNALLGGVKTENGDYGYNESKTVFAIGVNTGFNVKIKKYLLIRPIQVGFAVTPSNPYDFSGTGTKSKAAIQIATGVIFRF
jgi:hypothetical protein